MRKLILVLIFLSFFCLPCIAEQQLIISYETHQTLEPFSNELYEFGQSAPDFNDASITETINVARSAVEQFHTVFVDITFMIFIEETHSEHNKESINLIKMRIKDALGNIDIMIKWVELHDQPRQIKSYVEKSIHYLNLIKQLLQKINSELPS